MANTVAHMGVQVSWTSTGTGDTLTCSDMSQLNRDGIELDANGITLESATITVTTAAGTSQVVAAPTGSGNRCLIGQFFAMSQIVLSGVAAGTYLVKFSSY